MMYDKSLYKYEDIVQKHLDRISKKFRCVSLLVRSYGHDPVNHE